MSWTTTADIRARVRRRWDDGSLLRAYAAREPFPVLDIPLRGPRASEIGDRLAEAQAWAAALDAGRHDNTRYELTYTGIGGRLVGRSDIPGRAVVSTYRQAWTLVGVTADVRRYDEVLVLTATEPEVRAWVAAEPHRAIASHADWPGLLAAYAWLNRVRGRGRQLREIDAPGVDTKFVERHRAVLASLLGVPATAAGFAAGLGLIARPETVRLRFAPGFAGMPLQLTEGTFRREELARLRVSVGRAVVVENEATFLSVPVPAEGVVVWGKGFEVDRAGSLPWLRDADVRYWGDLDTHGFAILDRLLAWLPQTRPFLMDEETLLAHRDRWVVEATPTRARLGRLGAAEATLYDDLVSDRWGDRVRLEQERVDWAWVVPRLPFDD